MMNHRTLLAASFLAASAVPAAAASLSELAAETPLPGQMTFTADRIAADNVTKAVVATGHVVATVSPVTLRGESLSRSPDGTVRFGGDTCVTTCTNDVGHTHWNVSGEVEYKADDHVLVRNAWLTFYEIPVLYLPYLYYPLGTDCGFSWMPGYTDQWGAYLLTKYTYHVLGDPSHGDDTAWLRAATRFDLRWEQGIALGETLRWNLGDFGTGKLNAYYAWDRSDDYGDDGIHDRGRERYYYRNWSSDVPEDRYGVQLTHRWNATERDVVRLRGSVFSDSVFRDDFFRESLFNIKNQWLDHEGNEAAWEHNESAFGAGISVSGPLNDFYGGTARMPEIYFDVSPTPVFGLPVNYESQSRIGYLGRQPTEYGSGNRLDVYAFRPGPWADYETFRFDTYHRLTAPFRTLDDVVSVVPRVGYRCTYWHNAGEAETTGWEYAGSSGNLCRSIVEGGATFAARGSAWIDERWRHMVEPYIDVLAQEAYLSGSGNGKRPYVFDNIDASIMWEDQFAGRGRSLPYSYYGVTPGLRNAFDAADERGNLRTVVDVDVYAALQFNTTEWIDPTDPTLKRDHHRLAEVGKPNYGDSACTVMPGARLRWSPDEDIKFAAASEYDSENNKIAVADVGMKQKVNDDFSYYATYQLRDYRWWDYSSSPYDPRRMTGDDFNWVTFHYVQVGFTQKPIDWFAWSPFLRWDLREGELDTVGAWFDYLTDCLGFRLVVSYDNEYTQLDGYSRGDHWHCSFLIYLRALGEDAANFFSN